MYALKNHKYVFNIIADVDAFNIITQCMHLRESDVYAFNRITLCMHLTESHYVCIKQNHIM